MSTGQDFDRGRRSPYSSYLCGTPLCRKSVFVSSSCVVTNSHVSRPPWGWCVIVDKMVVLVRGLLRLWHTVFEMNVVCSVLHMELRDNKGKK